MSAPDAGPERPAGAVDPDDALKLRKLRDGALLLPLLGLALLMPPVAQIFALDIALGGVPLVVAYVFSVWLALILIAARLSARLGR